MRLALQNAGISRGLAEGSSAPSPLDVVRRGLEKRTGTEGENLVLKDGVPICFAGESLRRVGTMEGALGLTSVRS
jgi:hypothetical protein